MTAAAYIYIMGRGHSGSTVLDALLGNGVDVVGVGELAMGMKRLQGECGCGATVEQCPFWSRIRDQFEQELGMSWTAAARMTTRQAHIARFLWTLRARARDAEVRRLKDVNVGVAKAIASVSGADTIVDSTKEFTRGLFLARFLPDARIIHLVRNPLNTLSSHLQRIRAGDGFPFLRHRFRAQWLEPVLMILAAINWIIGNVLGAVVRRVAPSRVLRVRYEDLCQNPGRELLRLEDFLQCDLSAVREAVREDRSLPLGHKIAGNRMRDAEEFTFRPGAGGSRHLPWYYSVMVRALTWPMMLAHGYPVLESETRAS